MTIDASIRKEEARTTRKLKKTGNTKIEKPRNTTATTITIDNTITIINTITITITIWHTLAFTNANHWRRTCFEEILQRDSREATDTPWHSRMRIFGGGHASAKSCRETVAKQQTHSGMDNSLSSWASSSVSNQSKTILKYFAWYYIVSNQTNTILKYFEWNHIDITIFIVSNQINNDIKVFRMRSHRYYIVSNQIKTILKYFEWSQIDITMFRIRSKRY